MLTNPFLRLRKRSAFLSIVSLLLFSIGARAKQWGYYTYEVVNGNTVTITGYTGPDGAITIPSVIDEKPVTAIGERAFFYCDGLTGNLVIPEGVTSIGDNAFHRCSGLNGTLTLPSTLESIGVYAFDGCDGLNGNLVIPQGVTSIGNQAFEGCSGLASVTFKGHAPELKGSPFACMADNFKVYFRQGKEGFTTPTWQGYPCEEM